MCVWRGTWFGLVSKYIIYDKYGHEIRKIGKNTNKTQTDLAFKKRRKDECIKNVMSFLLKVTF